MAALLVGAIAMLVSCPPPAPERARPGQGHAPTPVAAGAVGPARVVVLVAIDGVRWQDVFDGVDPVLARQAGLDDADIVTAADLVPNLWWLRSARGAALGAPGEGVVWASGPPVSLPGYFELLGGRRGGCADNGCAPVAWPTLADEFAAVAASPAEVAVFASWAPLARAAALDSARVLVSAGRGGTNQLELLRSDAVAAELHDAGEHADPEPGWGDYRPDAHTSALALHWLRAHTPRFLFLGLGDTDELGHHGDYAGYLGALRRADAVVGEVAIALAELSARGTETLMLVTADHGRGEGFADHGPSFPESGRVWLIASGDAVRVRGLVPSPTPRFLADVAPTVRRVAGLAESDDGVLTELLGR
jgi:hypothetical protein